MWGDYKSTDRRDSLNFGVQLTNIYIKPVLFDCMTKWILFDLGNVIVNHVLEGKESYDYNGNTFSGPEIEAIYSLNEYKEFSKGKVTESEFIKRFLEKSELNLTVSDFLEIYNQDITPIIGMKELLEKLQPNYFLAILTNEGKEWANIKIDNQKIRNLFKKIIISADLHELKPAKEFYLKALKILNVKPEECIFIDNQKKNCEVAEKLGIKSIVFENPNQLKKELVTLSINID